MPFNRVAFSRVSHISFPVRHLMISVGWYRAVLGFHELDFVDGDGWQSVLVMHEPSATVIELRQPVAERPPSEPGGLSALGFMVESRTALEDWQEHFIRLSVDHTPIVDGERGSVLAFRDPNGLQLEMVAPGGHG
jgi:catechol 2,3-dioxygenase-like lactoylglutathione lyase family enzyme